MKVGASSDAEESTGSGGFSSFGNLRGDATTVGGTDIHLSVVLAGNVFSLSITGASLIKASSEEFYQGRNGYEIESLVHILVAAYRKLHNQRQ